MQFKIKIRLINFVKNLLKRGSSNDDNIDDFLET